jgi:hypothetical protein
MRCRIRVKAHLLDCPAMTQRAITLQLLIGLISIWKYKELCIRCLGIHLLREAGGRLHLLETPDSCAPLIVEIVSEIIGHAVPVDEIAVRRDRGEVNPITRDAPAQRVATPMHFATEATFPVPTTPVVALSLAAAMGTCAVTGAAIAVSRTMSDDEP